MYVGEFVLSFTANNIHLSHNLSFIIILPPTQKRRSKPPIYQTCWFLLAQNDLNQPCSQLSPQTTKMTMDSYHFSPELQTIWWPKKPHLWWHRDPPVDVGQDLWRPQPQPGGQPGAAVAVKGLDGKLCKAPLFRRRMVRGTFSKTIRLAPLVASGLEFLSQTEVCA